MLRLIPPNEISFEWDRVRAGLVEVKTATTDDWLPEDVYMAIRGGGASLYVGEDKHGDYLGFIVLRLVTTFHGKSVEIWCAHSATSAPLMRTFWPQIQSIGQEVGANKISFSSSRDEWHAASKRLGFVPKQTIYEFSL